MTNELKALVESVNGLQSDMKATLDKQAQEIKAYGETTTATAKQIEAINARLEEVNAEMTRMARPTNGTSTNASVGARFVASDAYKNMVASNMTSSATFEVGSFHNLLSNTEAPGVAEPHRVPGIIMPAQRIVRLRDVLRVVPTTSASIEFVQETGFVNAAAARAEGDQAAQTSLTYALKAANVQTLSHFTPATRQILSDAGQLRAAIDGRLVYGLGLVEDAQILYGSGVGENLGGIMANADIQEYTQAAGETKIDAIRRAIVKAAVAEYPVDAILLNPADFAEIELVKGSDERYVWVSVADGGVARLWRVPVIESNAVQAGEALLGAFALGATLYDREAATVRVSDSHADYFTAGKVAILAEERVALTVERPESFVKVTFA